MVRIALILVVAVVGCQTGRNCDGRACRPSSSCQVACPTSGSHHAIGDSEPIPPAPYHAPAPTDFNDTPGPPTDSGWGPHTPDTAPTDAAPSDITPATPRTEAPRDALPAPSAPSVPAPSPAS